MDQADSEGVARIEVEAQEAMMTIRVTASRGVPLLLLAALLAAPACGPSPGDDDDTGTEEGPTCTWEKVYDEQAFWFQGFSADEIYSLTAYDVLRWDGSSWTPFFQEKDGINMTAPFVDDERSFYFGTHSDQPEDCILWKYNDGDWSCLWNESESIYFAGTIWGTGATNEITCVTNGLSADSSIYRYDPSGTWTEVWSGYGDIEKIWGRGPDDIYAIGTGFGDAYAYVNAIHYDGTGWKELPPIPDGSADVIYDVTGDPGGNTWFVGMNESGDNTFPFLGRYDGSAWEVVIDSGDVEWDDESHYTGYLEAIHFFDDGKAVAVGVHLAYFYDGVKWWEVTPSSFIGNALWGVSAQDFHLAGYVDGSVGILRGSCQ
jgi:hypothetical protein